MRPLAFILSLLLCSTTVNAQNARQQAPSTEAVSPFQSIDFGGIVFQDECYKKLQASDADGSGSVDRQEYVDFAKAMSPPGTIDNVSNFDDLPNPYTKAYSFISCLCKDPSLGGNASATDCCTGDNARIRIPTPPDANQTSADFQYLYAVCYSTEEASQQTLNSPAPTVQPTPPPTRGPTPVPTRKVTPPPTRGPTAPPSRGPTPQPTLAPTKSPSSTPTRKPTRPPTLPPTRQPSSGPTPAPTTLPPTGKPTKKPTLRPTTMNPTPRPTKAPTRLPTSINPTPRPTLSPTRHPTSANPTPRPTKGPTLRPTRAPTLLPTKVATRTPTKSPTRAPTKRPTKVPTPRPTVTLTDKPSTLPSPSPTLSPTRKPVAHPSSAPSVSSTPRPTVILSASEITDTPRGPVQTSHPTVPTATPSLVVTPAQSGSPSNVPVASTSTVLPSNNETNFPTSLVANRPTSSSFLDTSGLPTSNPNATPTITPQNGLSTNTPSATHSPTFVPFVTPNPNQAPTVSPVREAQVTYSIAVRNGKSNDVFRSEAFQTSYFSDLVVSMDRLATDVATETFLDRRRLRRLVVTVRLPTGIKEADDIPCNPDITAPEDRCQDVTAIIRLSFTDEQNRSQLVQNFEFDLSEAITMGRLQNYLDGVNPDSPVYILTGLQERSALPSQDDNLSSGITASIVLAALFVIIVPIALLLYRRHQEDTDDEKAKMEYTPYLEGGRVETGPDAAPEDDRSNVNPESIESASLYTDSIMGGDNNGTAVTLGASEPDYGNQSNRKALEDMEAGEDIVAEPEMDVDRDSSSNAGSSGWSSSAGLSSLNTGSVDDSMDVAAAAGATLASIGVTSALSRKLERDRQAETPLISDVPNVSREQLDDLIEAGDWAAVGATAALLAAASDSQSASSYSRVSRSSGGNRSIDAARAAELDNLVDAGDWEGVVLAAAKYEAQEGRSSNTSDKGSKSSAESTSDASGASGASGSDSGTGTSGGGTGGSPSLSTSLSETPSAAQRRAEIRAEVEALVRRVVPEEIDNVGEMMNQFKGREEELVETLRTMQERAIAQKARTTGQKMAKVEARRTVQRGGSGTVAQRVAMLDKQGQDPREISSAAESSSDPSPSSIQSPSSNKSPPDAMSRGESSSGVDSEWREKRSALERAIETGDWDAVGEAAAFMSDASVTTHSENTLTELQPSTLGSSSMDVGSVRSKRSLAGIDAERASAIDALIDQGDWAGVMEAAKKFSNYDRSASSNQASKEEEDALAQAALWMKIAEQKKAEGASDAGASDAAEWAIQRSLSQLREADKKKTTGNKDEDEV